MGGEESRTEKTGDEQLFVWGIMRGKALMNHDGARVDRLSLELQRHDVAEHREGKTGHGRGRGR
mgnify:CR=1 FL=1